MARHAGSSDSASLPWLLNPIPPLGHRQYVSPAHQMTVNHLLQVKPLCLIHVEMRKIKKSALCYYVLIGFFFYFFFTLLRLDTDAVIQTGTNTYAHT